MTMRDDEDTLAYFAYGSNLSSRRLCSRVPGAVPLGPAVLQGHRRVFDKPSRDGSGKAGCVATGNARDRVHGGLVRIPRLALADLDRAEGADGPDPGYRRAGVVVATGAGPVPAFTYLALRRRPGLRPYPWYLGHLLVGAREFGLPLDERRRIAAEPTQPDPTPGRPEREAAIHAAPLIRGEAPGEEADIAALVTQAFLGAPHSDGSEAAIVDRLRRRGALAVSLVAEAAGTPIGHVAFSPIAITPAADGARGWFGLGPLAVAAAWRRRGIGQALVEAGLARLRAAGGAGCVVLGDPAYYHRFGFAADDRLRLPGVPPECFQALPFASDRPGGTVAYDAAFGSA